MFISVPGWKPVWLAWNTEAIFEKVSDFWRNEKLVRRYIPDYKFSSWRQIHKNYPVELFKYNQDNGNAEEVYVMLDNTKAEIKIIVLPL